MAAEANNVEPPPLTGQRQQLRQRPGWRWVWRGLRIVLLVYLGLILVFAMLQNWLIFRGSHTQGRREAIVRPAGDEQLLKLRTGGGETVAAIFGPAQRADGTPHSDARHGPTLIYFYGNGMCLADNIGLFKKLRRLECNVLAAEFVGYGMSSGRASEEGCYQTADAAYDHLLTRTDIDPFRIVPAGWSLGGAVAIDLASRRQVAGVAVFSTFTSMAEVADTVLPYFPNSLLLRHRFESERKLGSIKQPLFIAHGQRDTLIPYRMCQRLTACRDGAPTTCHTVQHADHNDIFEVGGGELLGELKRFLDSLAPTGSPGT